MNILNGTPFNRVGSHSNLLSSKPITIPLKSSSLKEKRQSRSLDDKKYGRKSSFDKTDSKSNSTNFVDRPIDHHLVKNGFSSKILQEPQQPSRPSINDQISELIKKKRKGDITKSGSNDSIFTELTTSNNSSSNSTSSSVMNSPASTVSSKRSSRSSRGDSMIEPLNLDSSQTDLDDSDTVDSPIRDEPKQNETKQLDYLHTSSLNNLLNSSKDDLSPNKFIHSHKSPFITYSEMKKFDPVNNAMGAGIIPWTYHEGKLLFLLQIRDDQTIKDKGFNDFGGKKDSKNEKPFEIAAREFVEETECLFYLQEKIKDEPSNYFWRIIYTNLKNNNKTNYSPEELGLLRQIMTEATAYFKKKLSDNLNDCLYVSCQETYISFLLRTDYVPIVDIPRAEDMHVDYEVRYMRTCKWFTYDELINLDEQLFHKRLQITKIRERIKKMYHDNKFGS